MGFFLDYLWIIKQLSITTLGSIVGFAIGKYFTKALQNDKEQKQIADSNDCHIALIVNNGLKMGKGKVAAQCGHAVVGVLKRIRKHNVQLFKRCGSGECSLQLYQVDSSDDFEELSAEASKHSLISYVVADAGRTQIASGSLTVLGIGPASDQRIKQIVVGLKPYV